MNSSKCRHLLVPSHLYLSEKRKQIPIKDHCGHSRVKAQRWVCIRAADGCGAVKVCVPRLWQAKAFMGEVRRLLI